MAIESGDIVLRKSEDADKRPFYDLVTRDMTWKEYDGPYFPFTSPPYEKFIESQFWKRLCEGTNARLIEYQGKVVGIVTFYWESEATRWLEIGIVIYSPDDWSKGIGRKALTPWITHLFDTKEIARVGLTTWSGNPRMIKCAQALGMRLEGTIRKVRYHNGVYYDSVKLGVLREEWNANR